MRLTPGQRQELLKKGFTRIPGGVGKTLIAAALREVNNMIGLERGRASPKADGGYDNKDYWTEKMGTPAIMDLLKESPASELCEGLFGRGKVLPETKAQIAMRFPSLGNGREPLHLHVDNLFYHGQAWRPPTGRIESFTLLVHVLLSDLPHGFSGNFAVSPGSHLLISDYIRRRGLGSFLTGSAKIRLPPAEQITGKAGDLVLCHYLAAHDRELNHSPHIRYAAFFRMKHSDHVARQIQALSDPWMEWPGLRQ